MVDVAVRPGQGVFVGSEATGVLREGCVKRPIPAMIGIINLIKVVPPLDSRDLGSNSEVQTSTT
jgi:hypothetical protein